MLKKGVRLWTGIPAKMDVESLDCIVLSTLNLNEGGPYIIEGRRKKEVEDED